MRNHSLLVLLALVVTGCAHINAPPGSVPAALDAPRDPFGGWASVWEGKGYEPTFEGELLAVTADSVFVLVDDTLRARAWTGVRRTRVVGYDPKAGDLQTWTLLGTLSTLSHGVVAILSAPTWVLLGSITTSVSARVSEINIPARHKTWEDLRPYARFPQGLPADLDRHALKPRAVTGGKGR